MNITKCTVTVTFLAALSSSPAVFAQVATTCMPLPPGVTTLPAGFMLPPGVTVCPATILAPVLARAPAATPASSSINKGSHDEKRDDGREESQMDDDGDIIF